MAEEDTPGFGGWSQGRAASGSHAGDRATDRLTSLSNKIADAFEHLHVKINKMASGQGGFSNNTNQWGPTQQSNAPGNGGHSTPFSSAGSAFSPPFTTGGQHSASGGQGTWWPWQSAAGPAGTHQYTPGNGGVPPTKPGSGTHAAPGGGVPWGTTAKVVGGAAVAAGAIYTANHYTSQAVGQTLAATYAYGPDWSKAYQNMLPNNATAASGQDHQAAIQMMGNRGGYTGSSAGFRQTAVGIQSLSAVNPEITNTQGAQASFALGSTESFNRLAGMGINPMGSMGNGDPRSVARQILQRMGSNRVKTAEQIAAAFGPAGSATVTLNAYAASGMIPPESIEAVRSEMRNILLAQVNGMSYSQYNTTARAATSTSGEGEDARSRLAQAGIAADTAIGKQRASEGMRRDTEAHTIEGFMDGMSAATEVVDQFRAALNKVMEIPGVGWLAGAGTGATGTMPVLGNLLNRFPGGGMVQGALGLMGDGPSAYSGAAMSYGGAVAAGGSGTPSMSASATMYAGRTGSSSGGGGGGGSTGSATKASTYSLGAVKPWVAKAANHLGPKFGISTIGGYRASSAVSNSDHPKGLALDLMCSTSQGNKLAPYAVANHKALNITYVIWRQRIWSINNPSWKAMEDRGSPTANHMDHVHISFLASPTNPDLGGLKGGTGGMTTGGGGGGGNGGGGGGDNGGSAFTASSGGVATGGGSSYGGFSEVAALGLGGGSGMPGGGFAETEGSGGGSGGGMGGMGGQGGPANLGIGTYNVLFSTSNKATQDDLSQIIQKVGVLGMQEMTGKKMGLRGWLRNKDWGYYQSGFGDSGVAWNKDKYTALQTKGIDLVNSKRYGGGRGNTGGSYVLLQDKDSGTKFWVISSHAQAHGYDKGEKPGQYVPGANEVQDQQYKQLAALQAKLKKTGFPVFNIGDFNERIRSKAAAPGSKHYGPGIDKIFYTGAQGKGGGVTDSGMSSDHPFVWGKFHIPGAGGGGLGKSDPYRPGAGVGQWQDEVIFAMKKAGIKPTKDNVARTLMQMKSESSGNPTIVNKWDSNWAAGHPSVGLMQVIEGTFNAYAGPYKNVGPKSYGVSTNPIANIYASLKYAVDRYGSLKNAYQGHGYEIGSWNIRADQDTRVHKGEMILPAKISEVVRSELTAPGIRGKLSSGGGGVQISFEPGSIVVKLGGNPTKAEARQSGTWVVDAIMEDARFKALAEG